MYIALATSLTSQVSCLKAPDFGGMKSEVEVPNGAVNYFKNDMDFDFDGKFEESGVIPYVTVAAKDKIEDYDGAYIRQIIRDKNQLILEVQ